MSKLKKGDEVVVTLGKDSGKSGKIEKLWAREGKALILGLNVVKRHVRKQGSLEGGIIDLPKPVKLSNLMLICPNCQKPSRVGYKILGDAKVRFCKKCKKEIKA